MVRKGLLLAVVVAVSAVLVAGCATMEKRDSRPSLEKSREWYGVHFFSPKPGELPLFKQAIVEELVPMGINTIVLEVNYRYKFVSHPELRAADALSSEEAHDLARFCREHGVRLIPQFQCLGHQSWAETTFELLTVYPELDETPGISKDNKGIYCRSWCPLHPKVNPIIFDLMDELIDGFEADAMHVGMDEVFLIADENCPRCKGKDPAELFAKVVDEYHEHLVGKRKVAMLMWGDRLLDAKILPYGEWEASANGTAPAVDAIAKDIIVCDWHYEPRDDYPSLAYLAEKGFRVWPASWHRLEATTKMMECARSIPAEKLVGQLYCMWVPCGEASKVLLGDEEGVHENAVAAVATLRKCAPRPKTE